MRHYSRNEWRKFRDEVIELDGGICCRCKRSRLEGAILSVHHKEYLPGRLDWQYSYSSCETLCQGCHAKEHGKIVPTYGWVCIGEDDLGDLTGECEYCHTPLRYTFLIEHEKWPILEVGEYCCDQLTQSNEASQFLTSKNRLAARERRFLTSPRWRDGSNDSLSIEQKGQIFVIVKLESGFRIFVNGREGKRIFDSPKDCKKHIFAILEDGRLETFMNNKICRSSIP